MKSAKNIFREYLRKNGMLYSKQREQILDIFLGAEKHLTINELYDLVRKKNPQIGLATVHRTMRVIDNAGLARKVGFGDGIKRFEHKYRHPEHDHLICTECGGVIEVFSPEIEKLQKDLAKKHDFTLVSRKMRLFGICKNCKRKAKQRRGH